MFKIGDEVTYYDHDFMVVAVTSTQVICWGLLDGDEDATVIRVPFNAVKPKKVQARKDLRKGHNSDPEAS